jgi:hypothetical protein
LDFHKTVYVLISRRAYHQRTQPSTTKYAVHIFEEFQLRLGSGGGHRVTYIVKSQSYWLEGDRLRFLNFCPVWYRNNIGSCVRAVLHTRQSNHREDATKQPIWNKIQKAVAYPDLPKHSSTWINEPIISKYLVWVIPASLPKLVNNKSAVRPSKGIPPAEIRARRNN